MENVEQILENFYNNYDEESRLVRDKSHRLEFITTRGHIRQFLTMPIQQQEMALKQK